jgi:hypothetical protein
LPSCLPHSAACVLQTCSSGHRKINAELDVSFLYLRDTAFVGLAREYRYTAEEVVAQMKGYTGSQTSARLTSLHLSPTTSAALLSTYKGFGSVYWRCVNRITGKLEHTLEKGGANFDDVLKQELRLLAEFADVLKKRPASTATAKLLAAVVFAWWTVSDCRLALEAMRAEASGGGGGGGAKDTHYLRQPHAAQLLSVFRLLGLDGARAEGPPFAEAREDYVDEDSVDENEGPFAKMFRLDADLDAEDKLSPMNLHNHMAEIKTGEGVCVTVSVS